MSSRRTNDESQKPTEMFPRRRCIFRPSIKSVPSQTPNPDQFLLVIGSLMPMCPPPFFQPDSFGSHLPLSVPPLSQQDNQSVVPPSNKQPAHIVCHQAENTIIYSFASSFFALQSVYIGKCHIAGGNVAWVLTLSGP